jgi:3-(3-hydroxy-phenyl)propionate hydroxylase
MRDAANLAWKLIAVSRGANEAILDTYQSEREAHVRPIISLAMMMGRTVCIADPIAAKTRDEQMLAARAAGSSPDGAVSNPPLGPGYLLSGSPEAGSYFPQFVTNQNQRLDDILGPGAWLITRSRPIKGSVGDSVEVVALDDPRLSRFSSQLEVWLARHNAQAVLVRPDRYVFGVGTPDVLAHEWSVGALSKRA